MPLEKENRRKSERRLGQVTEVSSSQRGVTLGSILSQGKLLRDLSR